MSRRLEIYNGTIKANHVGSFTRNDVEFDIIMPGYDLQGRRRQAWTQFIYGGVPVFEVKLRSDVESAMEQFDKMWAKYITDNEDKLIPALQACAKARLKRFRDGVTGEAPAPALTHDGREEGKVYPA